MNVNLYWLLMEAKSWEYLAHAKRRDGFEIEAAAYEFCSMKLRQHLSMLGMSGQPSLQQLKAALEIYPKPAAATKADDAVGVGDVSGGHVALGTEGHPGSAGPESAAKLDSVGHPNLLGMLLFELPVILLTTVVVLAGTFKLRLQLCALRLELAYARREVRFLLKREFDALSVIGVRNFDMLQNFNGNLDNRRECFHGTNGSSAGSEKQLGRMMNNQPRNDNL